MLRSRFCSPEFCAARSSGRDTSKAGFYGAQDAARMNEETGGQLFKPENSALQMGADGGQVFSFVQHSTFFVFLRQGVPSSLPAQCLFRFTTGPRV